jgi:ribosomal protein S18 acetylase RimI-like enzyme
MTTSELLQLADANLAEFAREHARWLPPTRIEEHTDLLFTAAGTHAPGPWNAALALGTEAADPQRMLEGAGQFFDPLEHHSAIYVRAHLDLDLELACRQRGYALGWDSPGMVLRHTVPQSPAASSLSIDLVRSEAQARAFVEVAADAYETMQLPAALTQRLLSHSTRWNRPHSRAYVLTEADRPVAAAQLLWSHGIAGVYWVASVAQARRQGHAERITRQVCREAFAAGARAVILQASRGGENIYRRIGFEEITRYRTYRRPPATAARGVS